MRKKYNELLKRATSVLVIAGIFFCYCEMAPVCAEEQEVVPGRSSELLRTGQISCWNDEGKLVDFVGSAQDGEYQRGQVWPVPRFIHNGDGTITDSLTGLMWLKDSDCFGAVGWHAALQRLEGLNEGAVEPNCHDYQATFADWRLPELEELETLLDMEEAMPADYLKLNGFTQVAEKPYWTKTTYLNPLNAWTVNFGDGAIIYRNKLEDHPLLPVRRVQVAGASEAKEAVEPAVEPAETGENRRFVDNGDGTISDRTTGLMWLKNAGCLQDISWQDALSKTTTLGDNSSEQCRGYEGPYTDWTLPNRREMQSIVDYSHDYPALGKGHPFTNLTPQFWTATSSPLEPRKAFTVNIYDGSLAPKEKVEHAAAWPVRLVTPPTKRSRETTRSGLGEDVNPAYVARLDPELQTEVHWPPEPRFFHNGDGTSMDRITGYTWLTDANCFGKRSWEELPETLELFNNDPRRFTCEGYEVTFGDWMAPSIEDLKEILNPGEKNQAAWLSDVGIVNMQDSGDYWSSSETMINLYYAHVMNFKTGMVHNYPKSLKFFFWPRRALKIDPDRQPLLNMTVNAIGERITLGKSEPFSIALYLHTFGLRNPADFWFWYETPKGDAIWLSPIRTWKTRMTPVYQGSLFNLKNYEIFRGNTENLEPGDYVFYFAVDFQQNGVLDTPQYKSRTIFTVLEKGLVNEGEKKKLKEPPKVSLNVRAMPRPVLHQ